MEYHPPLLPIRFRSCADHFSLLGRIVQCVRELNDSKCWIPSHCCFSIGRRLTSKFSKFQSIHLSNGNLSSISPHFSSLVGLEKLTFDGNLFYVIPAILMKLPSLNTLHLSNNLIRDIPP